MKTHTQEQVVQDWGLTAEMLADKYQKKDGGEYPHPQLTRSEWRHEVASESTIAGYWAWVESQIDQFCCLVIDLDFENELEGSL